MQFAKYIENDIEADGLEDMYVEALQKIKEDPKFEKDVRATPITHKRHGNKVIPSEGDQYVRKVKMSNAQRKDRVHQKMRAARDKLMAATGGDDSDEE